LDNLELVLGRELAQGSRSQALDQGFLLSRIRMGRFHNQVVVKLDSGFAD
jgi:hypothetical protein